MLQLDAFLLEFVRLQKARAFRRLLRCYHWSSFCNHDTKTPGCASHIVLAWGVIYLRHMFDKGRTKSKDVDGDGEENGSEEDRLVRKVSVLAGGYNKLSRQHDDDHYHHQVDVTR